MSSIHFIGGEKGGVGKSVVARLLAQYCIDKRLPFAAFDADPSHGALARFYSGYCYTLDLLGPDGADAVFSHACDEQGRVVLVDLPAQAERTLARWMDAVDVEALAAESGIALVFWHVLDDGKDSLTLLGRLLERHGDRAEYVVVKNHGRGKDFSLFDTSSVKEQAGRLGATFVDLPELHGPAMQQIDRLDASFWAAVNHTATPQSLARLDRQRVRIFLHRAYEAFAKVPRLAAHQPPAAEDGPS